MIDYGGEREVRRRVAVSWFAGVPHLCFGIYRLCLRESVREELIVSMERLEAVERFEEHVQRSAGVFGVRRGL